MLGTFGSFIRVPREAEMRRYRRVWLYGWGAVAVVPIGLACVIWGPAVVVIVFVVTGACCGLLTTALGATNLRAASRESRRRGLRAGLIAGAGAVAVLALATMNAAFAALILLLAAATSPRAIACLMWVRRANEKLADGRPAKPVAPGTSEGAIEELTDPELCRAWRVSFGALLDASDPEDRGRVVRLRQRYLEELERRHPEEVRVWLDSAPRAADGPERYLRRTPPGGRDAA